ncbi:helix-turn-helix domain-containing protein [Paenibacillus sp. NPDC058177]|uniref:AraC family transcriptional regulator n=1 Tax=Paenibacillus sp. NPDC058177 TaxID=3346369 RepID=UPI0036D83348
MNKNLEEKNDYPDTLFPIEMYTVTRLSCIPRGRGFNGLHWHDEIQLTLVTSGWISMQINGDNYRLNSGEAIFINKGLLHVTTEMSADGQYVSFNFPEKLLCFFSGSRMELQYVQPYTNSSAFPAKILNKDVDWQAYLIQMLWDLKKMYDEPRYFGWEYEVACKINCMWMKLISHVPLQKNETNNKSKMQQLERVQSILSFIHQNYSEDISLADIAKSARVSIAECGRCFHKIVHTTPYNYLIGYRIKRSVELLDASRFTITEIATRVGFNHVNHYIQSFKKHHGITPGEYRKSKL